MPSGFAGRTGERKRKNIMRNIAQISFTYFVMGYAFNLLSILTFSVMLFSWRKKKVLELN